MVEADIPRIGRVQCLDWRGRGNVVRSQIGNTTWGRTRRSTPPRSASLSIYGGSRHSTHRPSSVFGLARPRKRGPVSDRKYDLGANAKIDPATERFPEYLWWKQTFHASAEFSVWIGAAEETWSGLRSEIRPGGEREDRPRHGALP